MVNVPDYQQWIVDLNYCGYRDHGAALEMAEHFAERAHKAGDKHYALLFQGDAAYYRGDSGNALQLAEEALGLKPHASYFHSNYAVLLTIHQQFEQAQEHFTRALELEPDNLHALTCIGVMIVRRGDEQSAMAYFDRVISIVESERDAAFHHKTARTFKNTTYRFNPYHWQALVNKSILLSHLGDKQGSIFYLDRALQINPHDCGILNKKGLLLLNYGQLDQAIAVFNETIDFDKHNIQALRNKGIALSRLGKTEESLYIFRSLLAFNPKDTDNHAWFTKLNEVFNDPNEIRKAAESWRQVLKEQNMPTADADAVIERLDSSQP